MPLKWLRKKVIAQARMGTHTLSGATQGPRNPPPPQHLSPARVAALAPPLQLEVNLRMTILQMMKRKTPNLTPPPKVTLTPRLRLLRTKIAKNQAERYSQWGIIALKVEQEKEKQKEI